MKKIVSLVLLTGMLTLMSFGRIQDCNAYANAKIVNVVPNSVNESMGKSDHCFSVASSIADQWMQNTGGSWDDSIPIFNDAMAICEVLV